MVVGEFTQEAQVVVIGGGPGGYSAAFRAAVMGAQAVLVDNRPQLGGVCLHEGCVPSKTLLGIAEAIAAARHAPTFGVEFGHSTINLPKVRDWVSQSVDTLARGLDGLCRKHGVERLVGSAQFDDNRHISVRDGSAGMTRLRFRKAIIATGSRPMPPPFAVDDDPRIMTPRQALMIQEVPETLLVIGGNYMAAELATIYAYLGSRVTLAMEHDRPLIDADEDLVRPLIRSLKSQLTTVHFGARVESLAAAAGIHVRFVGDKPESATFDRAIVCMDEQANLDGLNLDRTAAKLDGQGFIVVDARMKTSDPRVLASGDVTGPPLLADKAIHQGRVAGETAAGHDATFDPRAVPMVVFTDPNLAWCGLTEAQATARGIEHETAKLPWGASGRAVGLGRTEGLTKIIYDPATMLVLGVGIVGRGAAEMIPQGCLAVEMGAVLGDLAATIHPHPTASELLSDAAAEVDLASRRPTSSP